MVGWLVILFLVELRTARVHTHRCTCIYIDTETHKWRETHTHTIYAHTFTSQLTPSKGGCWSQMQIEWSAEQVANRFPKKSYWASNM